MTRSPPSPSTTHLTGFIQLSCRDLKKSSPSSVLIPSKKSWSDPKLFKQWDISSTLSNKTHRFSIQSAKKSWEVSFKCSKLSLKMISFINHSLSCMKMLLNAWNKISVFTQIKFSILLISLEPGKFMLKSLINIKRLKNNKINRWTESSN